MTFADFQLGRVVSRLDHSPLVNSTVVVLTSDHGWKLGEFGSWSKHTTFEADLRVPLMIRHPRAPGHARGVSSDAIVELIDLYPTIAQEGPRTKPSLTAPGYSPYLTQDTSLTTPRSSHLIHHTSLTTPHSPHLAHHSSLFTPRSPHITHDTSLTTPRSPHVTHHFSFGTLHSPHLAHHTSLTTRLTTLHSPHLSSSTTLRTPQLANHSSLTTTLYNTSRTTYHPIAHASLTTPLSHRTPFTTSNSYSLTNPITLYLILAPFTPAPPRISYPTSTCTVVWSHPTPGTTRRHLIRLPPLLAPLPWWRGGSGACLIPKYASSLTPR